MKRVFLIVLMLCGTHVFAQELSTWGTDFWVAFMPNWYDGDEDSYTLCVSGPRDCSVTVVNPITGMVRTVDVQANTVTDISLPANQCWVQGSCVTRDKGLHIMSDDSIQVVAYNHGGTQSSCDATLLYTTASLGNEYVVQTYPSAISDNNAHSQFSILAIMDNTEIDISYRGNPTAGHWSGTTRTITLNAGQVYQVQGAHTQGDLSGTRIYSTDHACLPFAVFMGNSVTNCPSTNTNSSDHTFLQAVPTRAWQSEWVLTPSFYNDTDIVRVTAKSNSTDVRVNGSFVNTINSGQTYEFQITGPTHLSTTQPALVVQYLRSRPDVYPGFFGDVAAFVPNSLQCVSRNTAFKTLPLNRRGLYPNRWYLNVVAPTTEIGQLSLDAAPMTVASQQISGTPYSSVRMLLTEGEHQLSTTGSGFWAHTYGLSEYEEAYIMSLGGVYTFSEPITFHVDTVYDTVCNFPYIFYDYPIYYPGEYTVTATCRQKHHLILTGLTQDTTVVDTLVCGSICLWMDSTYSQPGTYYYSWGRDRYGCDKVAQLNLELRPTFDTSLVYRVCDSTFTFLDSTFVMADAPIDSPFLLNTIHGCDSMVRLHLEVGEPLYTDIDWGSCTDTLYPYADTMLRVPGIHQFNYLSYLGCDSIVTLRLERYPSYHIVTEDTIPYGLTYQWLDGLTFDDSANVELEFETVLGCDSIRHLILHVKYPDQALVWVPNVFTPNRAENNTFRILSDKVDQMEVSIFDRRGDCVCVFDGLTGSWDGTHNGTPCPQGSYVCQVRYHVVGSRAKEFPITRIVTLLR